jgi:iron complex transport system ATP-binding protein
MTLQADAVSLRLRDRLILEDVTFICPKGRVTVLIGPNGAGKSSLLSCIAAIRNPDKGRILLDAHPITDIPAIERARRIGLLPQKGDIHWDINVRALVALGRLPYRDRWRRDANDNAAIDQAMVQTDCFHLADRKAQRLSGGEQARVLLARVLAGRPEWILADEPLANLDPSHQIDAVTSFKNIAANGTGVVLVLHDLTQAARVADHVVIMKKGRVLTSGAPEKMLTQKLLAEAFDVAVHISADQNGIPIITPIGRAA